MTDEQTQTLIDAQSFGPFEKAQWLSIYIHGREFDIRRDPPVKFQDRVIAFT